MRALELLSASHRVRELAAKALADVRPDAPELRRLLTEDPAWAVRLVAARCLPLGPELFAVGLDDPHWRPRAALVERLVHAVEHREALLALAGHSPRIDGALAYLQWRWRGAPDDWAAPDPAAAARPAFWSDDPAVFERRVKATDLRPHARWLAFLAVHGRPAVRTVAIKAIGRWASTETCLELVEAARDARRPHALDSLTRLLPRLDATRYHATVAVLLELHGPGARVAIESMDGDTLGVHRVAVEARADEPADTACRRAARRALGRAVEPLPAAAPVTRTVADPSPVTAELGDAAPRVRLAGGAEVSRMGVSGHYGLPARGYEVALDRGIDFFFWEPSYTEQARFFRRLSARQKAPLTVLAGTFDLEAKALRRAVHGALRNLGLEQLGLFFLFWVRDAERLGDDVRGTLEALKAQGDIGDYGFSTHQYALAETAMREGWRHVMLRHNVGHRTAEKRCLPLAGELGASVITFSNLCYGRALEPGQVEPAALYRFSLETPGVAACLSAPSTVAQLEHNLEALVGENAPAQRRALSEKGAALRAEDTAFARCLRWR